jgi:hypothetical protein
MSVFVYLDAIRLNKLHKVSTKVFAGLEYTAVECFQMALLSSGV